MRSIHTVFLLLLGACRVAAQAGQLPDRAISAIDSIVAKHLEDQHVPGVALGVVRGGRLVHARGYGLANLEHQVPVVAETPFEIGSLSKQFLAAGIMILVQDGKVELDAPLARYLPEAPPSWSAITLRQFLTHTSGVIREGPAFDPFKPQPDSVVVASTFDTPLAFPTGTKFQYCNVCYFALADLIRRVSGQPWPEFMETRVFRPAGLTATRAMDPIRIVEKRAYGYDWNEKTGWGQALEFPALRPSGAFWSTIGDLARWEAVLSGASGASLLTPASREAMFARARLNDGTNATLSPDGDAGYGFGWMIDDLDGHPQVHHGGSLPGFRAHYMRFPDDSLAVIVLTNGNDALPGQTAIAVAKVLLGIE